MGKCEKIELWQALLMTICYYLLTVLISLIFLLAEFGEKIPLSWKISALSLLDGIILFICIYIFLKKYTGFSTIKIIRTNMNWRLYLYPIFLGIFFIFSQITFYSIQLGKPISDYLNGIVRYSDIPHLIGLVILVPTMEELFFRYFLLKGLTIKYDRKIGLFLSSILFGIAHLPDTEQALITFIGGGIAGYLYQEKDLLIQPILFHMSWNFTADVIF